MPEMKEYTYEACMELINKPAGHSIEINGVKWVRMVDYQDVYSCYFNTVTGLWAHASRLFIKKGDTYIKEVGGE